MSEKLPKNVILIRNFFDWVNRHPYRLILILVVLFLLISICFSPYQVNIGEVGIVRRFGRYVGRVATPGLNFHIPWGIDRITIVNSQKIQRLELYAIKGNNLVTGREFFTGDGNLVNVRCTLQYQIEDAPSYLFHVESPIQILFSQLQEMLVNESGTEDIDGILAGNKQNIEDGVLNALKEVIEPEGLGIKLLSFNLDWIMPPPAAFGAFMDVIDAKQDRYLAVNLADIHKTEVVSLARGIADRITDMANADAYTAVLQAQGEAERFRLLLVQNLAAPAETMLTEYYKMITKVVAETDIFVLRQGQGAHLEVNLLEKVLPPSAFGKEESEKRKEEKTKKQKKGSELSIGELLLPESAYEKTVDRAPGEGEHLEENQRELHLELPSTQFPIPSSEIEVHNGP